MYNESVQSTVIYIFDVEKELHVDLLYIYIYIDIAESNKIYVSLRLPTKYNKHLNCFFV